MDGIRNISQLKTIDDLRQLSHAIKWIRAAIKVLYSIIIPLESLLEK